MGEVIEFKSKDQVKVPNFKEIEEALSNLQDNEKSVAVIASCLALPENEFAFVSEVILNELEKSMNDPDSRYKLVQALNANGMKAEDLIEVYQQIFEIVDKETENQLSPQKRSFIKKFVGLIINSIEETEGIPRRIITVPIELCHEDAKIPQYAKLGDAGMDVYAVEDTEILPGETKIVKTGLKCALPLGYEFEVRPRSGLSLKTPLRVANSPGTIDSGYRDEIGVIITNIEPKIKDIEFDPETGKVTSYEYGQSYTITKGMRFAQLVLKEVPTCSFYEVTDVKSIGIDRESGFGGTGTN